MVIVMQGRLHSTRLPGKGFFTFFGQTIWERMCDIALSVKGVEEVVFATGDNPDNELIRPLIEAKGVRFFKASEDNVLQRYYEAIKNYKGDYLIRLTCDNYLIQPDLLEELYKITVKDKADYGYIEPLSHYAGEIIKCSTLREACLGSYSEEAREHVTWDIRNSHSTKKVVLPYSYMGINHKKSITLDTIEDFIKLKKLESLEVALKEIRCLDAIRQVQNNVS